MPSVLVVEDDGVIARAIAAHLRHAGLDVVVAEDGDKGLRKLRYEQHDVAVVDLMLPGLDGWALTQEARREGIATPILIVSARSSEHDKVHALEIGADDYLAKPFGMRELVARVQALLRRARTPARPGARPRRASTEGVERPLPLPRPLGRRLRAQAAREARPPLRLLLHPDPVRGRLPLRPDTPSRRSRVRRYPRDMATVSASPLLIEDAAGLRTLVLNRPERRNALSHALLNDLIAALAETAADTSVHAVILRGEGPGFCAGHDLSEMAGCSLPSARSLFETCSEMMMAIHRLPQPVIAQVHGIATAAGCQLVAACDLAIASEDARFATSGVRYGLFCSTPMVEVSRAVGRKRALEMLLTGELIDARTAADWGLVNRVVPRDQLGQATLELAGRITSASSHTLAVGKVAFYEQLDRALPEAYE